MFGQNIKSDGDISIFNRSFLIFSQHNKTDQSLPKNNIQFCTIMLLYTRSHEKPSQSDFEFDVVLAVLV